MPEKKPEIWNNEELTKKVKAVQRELANIKKSLKKKPS